MFSWFPSFSGSGPGKRVPLPQQKLHPAQHKSAPPSNFEAVNNQNCPTHNKSCSQPNTSPPHHPIWRQLKLNLPSPQQELHTTQHKSDPPFHFEVVVFSWFSWFSGSGPGKRVPLPQQTLHPTQHKSAPPSHLEAVNNLTLHRSQQELLTTQHKPTRPYHLDAVKMKTPPSHNKSCTQPNTSPPNHTIRRLLKSKLPHPQQELLTTQRKSTQPYHLKAVKIKNRTTHTTRAAYNPKQVIPTIPL